MVAHMKTTVEIPAPVLEEARKVAAREETSVKALIEEGLRLVLENRRGKKRIFRLRKASFKGQGLQQPISDASWEQIRDLAYQGRGA